MTTSTIVTPAPGEARAESPIEQGPVKQTPVKQWFSGEIEASYYGVPNRVPASSSDSIGRRYRLHIYRAAVPQAEPIDAGDLETTQSQQPFFQASIELAQLWGVRGPGTRYEGPIHDVSITRPQSRFHIVKDGKSYGTMRGYARGWMYLPTSAAPEPVLPTDFDHTHSDKPMGVLIREAQPDNAAKNIARDDHVPAADRKSEANETVVERNVIEVSVDDANTILPQRETSSHKTEPPYFSLCAAVGLLLWFACGVEQTLIWFLFMLPTLGMRRLVLEVLPDERGVQAFAAVMVLGAVLSSGTIFASFNAQHCWALGTVPLVVLVGSVFLSGIVPYRLPLAITALTFAGVLYVWGHSPEQHCAPEVPGESLPTIKDPGVPRTNDDGTWPRRVPTAENYSEGK